MQRPLVTPIVLLAILLLPVARVASAADWQLKPFLGSTFGGSTTLIQPAAATGGDISGNPKLSLGVSSLWLGEVLGIEGDFGHTSGFFGSNTPPVVNSGVTTYTGNLVFALPRRMTEYTLRPYIIGGAGIMHVNLEDRVAGVQIFQGGSDNLWAYDIGGGVTGFLTDHIGVSWDIRRFSALGGQNGILSTVVQGDTEHLSFWRANMSIAIRPIRHVRSTR